MSKQILQKVADNVRILSLSMVEKAKSGHPGGAMGGSDFISVLYSEFLNFDPDDPEWIFRDRFFLDPGHMSPMLYSILHLIGKYSIQEIQNFRQWKSPTHGHPEVDVSRGIENTSGPLGLGAAMGVGAAIAERFYAHRFGEWTSHKTYVFVSDGGMQEEIAFGVGRISGLLGLSNLIMFFDSNDIQLSHTTDKTTSEDTPSKYKSWGWRVETVDGNNVDEIRAALKRAVEEKEKPTLIIGKTIMGKGALTVDGKSFERQVSTHGQPLSNAGVDIAKTIKNLGGNPDEPFTVFEEVKDFFVKTLEEKRKIAKKAKEIQWKWEKENVELAKKLFEMFSKIPQNVDFSKVTSPVNSATRNASGAVLSYFAQNIGNMVVSSADLSNSDQTGKFLEKSKEFSYHDFSGGFLQAGVAELTMASIMNGLCLHGGIVPVCATFFVFSDYMKPAIRIAALQEIPVKYVFTHDSFRVGEDGPTHQPVEQEIQLRLLERVKNSKNEPSLLVLRPADCPETIAAWEIAYNNTNSPTALILTRQNVDDLPAQNSDRRKEAECAKNGCYIVLKEKSEKPDIILLANGSEVSLLYGVAKELEKENMSVRVVSAVCEGLFRMQSEEYQNRILPKFGVPIFGLTAGLPDSLLSLSGVFGKVVGHEKFGASAPAKVLDEKFGYTISTVKEKVKDYLEEYKRMLSAIK
ncbi:MAG: transketolase [Chitinispirillales bacterium]|jgi:transketolase|nr:transketolase [Chitinispirillales bacterium]